MLEITNIIGKGKAYEPPFRRRGKLVKDKRLRTLCLVKAYGTLSSMGLGGEERNKAERDIADHIVELLNERWKDETMRP